MPRLPTACLLALVLASAGTGEELVIPHRRAPIAVDGALADWRGQGAALQFREPGGPDANRVRVTLAWDEEWLYAAYAVTDGRIVPPPADARPAALYQGDSVELYVDGGGERGGAMDGNDFQFIAACDGRLATLQGEPVLARLKAFSVPKIERDAPGARAAVRRTAGGYVVELAVPLPAILTSLPRAGVRTALDVAVNDWDEPHPPVEEVSTDDMIEAARRVLREAPAGTERDPFAVALALGYRPWSPYSGRDLGYPSRWRPAVLAGGPPWLERMARRLGAARLVALAAAAVTAVWLLLLVVVEARHRRRVRALLRRLEHLDRAEPAPAPGAEGATPRHIAAALAGRDTGISDPTVARTLAVLRERIAQPLTPAGLAAAAHVSLRTLQRALGSELGCTPRELILGVKMHTARKLLASGEVRVGEAASRVGFDDPSHFSRRYRAYFGHPPSEDLPPAGRG